jgi:hypothetical protein
VENRPPGDEQRREDEDPGLPERGEVLGLAVAVGVAHVRRTGGDADGEEREQCGDEVGAGVDRLGDETEAVGREPRGELDGEKPSRREHRDERRPPLCRHTQTVSDGPAEAGPFTSSMSPAAMPSRCRR